MTHTEGFDLITSCFAQLLAGASRAGFLARRINKSRGIHLETWCIFHEVWLWWDPLFGGIRASYVRAPGSVSVPGPGFVLLTRRFANNTMSRLRIDPPPPHLPRGRQRRAATDQACGLGRGAGIHGFRSTPPQHTPTRHAPTSKGYPHADARQVCGAHSAGPVPSSRGQRAPGPEPAPDTCLLCQGAWWRSVIDWI